MMRGHAPSHHFDDGIRLSANQIVVVDERLAFVRGVLAKIADVVEACGQEVDFLRLDFGKAGLGQNIRGDVFD
jgi:hypothetical protein